MEIIYGNIIADNIKSSMKQKIDSTQGKRLPLLSVVLVGNNAASNSYVRGKEKGMCLNWYASTNDSFR